MFLTRDQSAVKYLNHYQYIQLNIYSKTLNPLKKFYHPSYCVFYVWGEKLFRFFQPLKLFFTFLLMSFVYHHLVYRIKMYYLTTEDDPLLQKAVAHLSTSIVNLNRIYKWTSNFLK